MATGLDLISEAAKFLGVPYKWGGTSPNGFDCSGFTQYVYKQLGLTLPRTSQDQYHATTRINASELQPGDLVFSEMGSDGPGHVGMYVGSIAQSGAAGARFGLTTSPMVIEAPHTGDKVKYIPLSSFGATGYGRVKGSTIASVTEKGSDITNSLISWPSSIIDYAKQATQNASTALGWADAFFEPTTYVRIGAGGLGLVFLIAGLGTLLIAAT
jgi:hypothetical protein